VLQFDDPFGASRDGMIIRFKLEFESLMIRGWLVSADERCKVTIAPEPPSRNESVEAYKGKSGSVVLAGEVSDWLKRHHRTDVPFPKRSRCHFTIRANEKSH
jgi:hypothetical protein